jgi:hypothetical protein
MAPRSTQADFCSFEQWYGTVVIIRSSRTWLDRSMMIFRSASPRNHSFTGPRSWRNCRPAPKQRKNGSDQARRFSRRKHCWLDRYGALRLSDPVCGAYRKAAAMAPLCRALAFGGTRGVDWCSFYWRQGLDPSVFNKAAFPLPQVHATFVISHKCL